MPLFYGGLKMHTKNTVGTQKMSYIMEEFGVAQVEMTHHLQKYEAERKSGAQGEVETV